MRYPEPGLLQVFSLQEILIMFALVIVIFILSMSVVKFLAVIWDVMKEE